METRIRKFLLRTLLLALLFPIPTLNGWVIITGFLVAAAVFTSFFYIPELLSLPDLYTFSISSAANAGIILSASDTRQMFWRFALDAIFLSMNIWWNYIYIMLIIFNYYLIENSSEFLKRAYRIYLVFSSFVMIYINVFDSRISDEMTIWPKMGMWLFVNMPWFAVLVEAIIWKNDLQRKKDQRLLVYKKYPRTDTNRT